MNWEERFRNKTFILALLSALAVLAQLVLPLFGVSLDYGKIGEIINALLGVLIILGVVVDPTTQGIGDSDLVLSRKKEEK